MTVKEFLQRHPNDTLDMMTPGGYVLLTPESSSNLLKGKPFYASAGVSDVYMELPAAELLYQEIHSIQPDSLRSGYFHLLTGISPPDNSKHLEHISLPGSTLLSADLSGVIFDRANFHGTTFDNANLAGCVFIDCDFAEARFTNCDLHNAAAVDCDFSSAIFEEGVTKGLCLRNCNMEAVSLYSVDLAHVTVDEQTKDTSSELREELAQVIDYTMLRPLNQRDVETMAANHALWVNDAGGAQANFSYCLLHGIDLKGLQLNNAIFDGAVLESCDLSCAGLCFSSFEETRFFDTDLADVQAEEANFRGAAFRECDLKDMKLTHSNLSRTRFFSSELQNMDIQNACVEGSDLADAGNWGVRWGNVSLDEQAWMQEISEGMTEMGGMT